MDDLAASYLAKARLRLEMLDLLFSREGWSDVVREAQELVELASKAMLRHVSIEPPKWHNVGSLLLEHAAFFSEDVRAHLPRVAEVSANLRKERELAFYGDEDFIPTAEYDREQAEKALDGARFVLSVAEKALARQAPATKS